MLRSRIEVGEAIVDWHVKTCNTEHSEMSDSEEVSWRCNIYIYFPRQRKNERFPPTWRMV